MEPESGARLKKIEEMFEQIDRLDEVTRAELVDQTCSDDQLLRTQVQRLLENYRSAHDLITSRTAPADLTSSQMPTSRMLSDGEIVAERFRIVRLLGVGGMGEVYEVEDLVLGQERIALKTLRASLAADENALERLSTELRLARRITHPNVCRVHDVYRDQNASGARLVFFTMELLEGDTLADRLRHEAVDQTAALSITRQIAAAVGAAHAANVVHGDLKPGNIILVGSERGGERVVVTDFGLARWLPVGSALLSASGDSRPCGTPAYMAPEQLWGGTITRSTDIYALGVVLYELVTGHRPYAVHSPMFLALKKLRHAPRPPREYVSDLHPQWEAAILRCLDVDPAKRFELATDVVKALESHGDRKPWQPVAVMALLLAGIVAITPVRSAIVDATASIWTTLVGDSTGERNLALLPFTQAQPAADDQAFSLGLTAGVTERLAALSGPDGRLYVVPAEQIIETDVQNPVMVRQTVGADVIVTGRVEANGGHVLVTVTLNEMERGGFVARDSRTVEDRGEDNELLQTKTLSAITDLLNLGQTSSNAGPTGRGTVHPAAEKSYLQGRGHLLRGTGGLLSAIAAFQKSLRENDQYAAAYSGLSEAYLGQYDETRDVRFLKSAETAIDRAIALNPLDARAHVVRGRSYLTTGQTRRAIAEFGRALDIDPNTPLARNQLAAAHEAEGATEMAEKEYRAAIGLHPRYWSVYEDFGTFLYRQGRYRDAEQHYVTGIGFAPANKRAIANLAAVYEIQERFLAAETELIKGLKLSPDPILYNNLGWIYILDGRLEDAVRALEEAVKLPGADSIVWSSLARAYRWAGRNDEDTRPAYQTALARTDDELRVNPLNMEVRANRAYLLAESRRTGEALQEIAAALASDNARGSVTVLFRSALVYESVGDRKRAIEALERAARGRYPLSRIARDPDLRQLRSDPAYRRVLETAGRPASPRF